MGGFLRIGAGDAGFLSASHPMDDRDFAQNEFR
jgi:hypothetical protein